MEKQIIPARDKSIFKVPFQSCPVQATLGSLGKKWALIILRDIAIYRIRRFNDILRANPTLNRRTLSMRLKELSDEGLIEISEKGTNFSKWELTHKGQDVLPILMAVLNFGIKWHADQVFKDKRSRALNEIFEGDYIQSILGSLVPDELE